ncbi:hypothetical protein F5884DRAFT_790654 [Xylogone sp. PMI_703]|nr:hypothetical protein F5884DRAFT_790654 [Xylogone sp. PMI_703]
MILTALKKTLYAMLIPYILIIVTSAISPAENPFLPKSDCIQCQKGDLSTVSGYYGPGALLAFLVTLSFTALRYEVPISDFFSLTSKEQPEHKQLIGLDAELVTALAWVFGAMVDLLVRIINRTEDPQCAAAHLSTRLGVLACAICIGTPQYPRGPLERKSSRTYALYFVWISGIVALLSRMLVTVLRFHLMQRNAVFLLSIASVSLSPIFLWPFYLFNLRKGIRILGKNGQVCLFVSFMILISDTIVIFLVGKETRSCVNIPLLWQMSSAKLTDMDQAASFTVVVGTTLLPKLVAWIKQHFRG